MADRTYLKARDSFVAAVVGPDGRSVEVAVAAGQVVGDDHPSIAGREHLFDALDDTVEGGRGRGRRGNN